MTCRSFANACFAFGLGLALAGCATPTTRPVDVDTGRAQTERQKQEELAVESGIRQNERVNNVVWPLLVSAAELCGDQAISSLGLVWFNIHDFSARDRGAVVRLYGMDESPRVLYVPPGSPAQIAGIQKGDVLNSVAGRPVPTARNANDDWRRLMKDALRPGTPASVVVSRAGTHVALEATPVRACDYPMAVLGNDAVNAMANGRGVAVTSGMLRFVENDGELAIVLAHEVAHNAMKHMDAKRTNASLGSILDIAAAIYGVNTHGMFGGLAGNIHSKGFESEADYVGLYLMARAGLPIDDTPAFWRRMAANNPSSIRGGYLATHPATPERFVALEQTIAEIKDKQARGELLLPNRKVSGSGARGGENDAGRSHIE
jgi:hypothetical protein